MKLTKNGKSFEPCPEFSGQAVVVDVTPLKKVETAFGPKETFRIAFETPLLREDGTSYCVWSRGFTPSLHEKSAFALFLRKWMGRVLTAAEEAEFDTESLIGQTAEITVVHEEGRTGETYANIGLIRPDKTGKTMSPSGKFKRSKDREQTNGAAATEPSRTEHTDDLHNPTDWRRTKVHVGKHNGLHVGDLNRDAVTGLIQHWLPETKGKAVPTAEDRGLMAALEAAKAESDAEGNLPMGNLPY